MPDTDTMHHIMESSKTVAVVGASPRKSRAGHYVPAYMQRHGYRIVPVNPHHDELLGEKCYPHLSVVPDPIDLVLVFRRPEYTPPIVEDAIEIGAKAVWLQLGIYNKQAQQTAQIAKLPFVMDACIMVEHRRLMH